MMRFAINGFGRVGRTLLRVYRSRPDAQAKLELAAINEIADADTVVTWRAMTPITAVTPDALPAPVICWPSISCWCH